MPGFLANFWQNGFWRRTTEKGKCVNSRVFVADLMVGHRPRPYQEGDLRNMFASSIETVST
jgi:hypothetical protein